MRGHQKSTFPFFYLEIHPHHPWGIAGHRLCAQGITPVAPWHQTCQYFHQSKRAGEIWWLRTQRPWLRPQRNEFWDTTLHGPWTPNDMWLLLRFGHFGGWSNFIRICREKIATPGHSSRPKGVVSHHPTQGHPFFIFTSPFWNEELSG